MFVEERAESRCVDTFYLESSNLFKPSIIFQIMNRAHQKVKYCRIFPFLDDVIGCHHGQTLANRTKSGPSFQILEVAVFMLSTHTAINQNGLT
jgi:hypothetical protein